MKIEIDLEICKKYDLTIEEVAVLTATSLQINKNITDEKDRIGFIKEIALELQSKGYFIRNENEKRFEFTDKAKKIFPDNSEKEIWFQELLDIYPKKVKDSFGKLKDRILWTNSIAEKLKEKYFRLVNSYEEHLEIIELTKKYIDTTNDLFYLKALSSYINQHNWNAMKEDKQSKEINNNKKFL